jgi:hypothetical protein
MFTPSPSRHAVSVAVAASFVMLAAGPAFGGDPAPEVTVLEAVADTSIFNTGGTSNGIGTELYCGRTGGGGGGAIQRSPIRFDLSSIPAGATIVDAQLTLTLLQAGSGAGTETHTVHRITGAWGEAGSDAQGGTGAPALPGDATWAHRVFPDLAWLTEGGDFAAAPSATLAIGNTAGTEWTFTGPLLVADVADWVNGAASVDGWMLIGDEAVMGSGRRFGAREFADEAARPRLTVSWTAPAACRGDLDGSGAIDFADVLLVLADFGPCTGCAADLDEDGAVTFADLLTLLANFGGCAA